MTRSTLAIIVTLACASGSLTITPASAQETKAPAQIDQLGAFTGDGTCTGKFMGMGKTPGHATTARFHGEKVLDGNWIFIRYEEDKTAANPRPYQVAQNFGYDGTKKQFVTGIFDNAGSGYGTGTSAGWKGDTISFDETSAMGGQKFRDTFTRNGTKELTHTGTMQDKNGKWIKMDEETCQKS